MVMLNQLIIPRLNQWAMLSIMLILSSILMQRSVFADRLAMQLPASEKIIIWFAMQLPLFVEWPNIPAKQSTQASQPISVVNFCLDASDYQRRFLSDKKTVKNVGYEFNVKFIEHTFQLDQCHIFIISKSQEHRLSSLLLAIKNKPILTVSDIDHFAQKGGMVAVFFDRERLHYICNLRVARDSGLKISSRILELAEEVYE